MLCYVMLCYVMLCYVMLCYVNCTCALLTTLNIEKKHLNAFYLPLIHQPKDNIAIDKNFVRYICVTFTKIFCSKHRLLVLFTVALSRCF